MAVKINDLFPVVCANFTGRDRTRVYGILRAVLHDREACGLRENSVRSLWEHRAMVADQLRDDHGDGVAELLSRLFMVAEVAEAAAAQTSPAAMVDASTTTSSTVEEDTSSDSSEDDAPTDSQDDASDQSGGTCVDAECLARLNWRLRAVEERLDNISSASRQRTAVGSLATALFAIFCAAGSAAGLIAALALDGAPHELAGRAVDNVVARLLVPGAALVQAMWGAVGL